MTDEQIKFKRSAFVPVADASLAGRADRLSELLHRLAFLQGELAARESGCCVQRASDVEDMDEFNGLTETAIKLAAGVYVDLLEQAAGDLQGPSPMVTKIKRCAGKLHLSVDEQARAMLPVPGYPREPALRP